METTVNVKIGPQAQRWMVHPRTNGDLILTSMAAIAVVDTRNKFAITASSMKQLGKHEERELIPLRQDVVDRLLDAESCTKASPFPSYRIDLTGIGVAAVLV